MALKSAFGISVNVLISYGDCTTMIDKIIKSFAKRSRNTKSEASNDSPLSGLFILPIPHVMSFLFIFGVSLTILCSSNCRKQVGSLLCAARWHLFVDTMHCWVLHHKYNKYIQFGSLAVPFEWFLNIRNYIYVYVRVFINACWDKKNMQEHTKVNTIYPVYMMYILCRYVMFVFLFTI